MPHPEITWAPRGNHVGPQGKSRGPHPEITWAPRGNHAGPTGKSRGPHEAQFLREKTDSARELQLLAELDGAVVGMAGIACVGEREKLRHRASLGIGIDRAYWGLGIGRALTQACIECAGRAGYAQLELDVVAENERAIALYESLGFTEFGRNPRGFRSRRGVWQELVLMRLELEETQDARGN